MESGRPKNRAKNTSKNCSGWLKILTEFVVQTDIPPQIVIVAKVTTKGIILRRAIANPFNEPMATPEITIVRQPNVTL
tara:strand:- start:68 stop:301 length:234 start_codon:yes stop_codon:yes gene_type:complete